MSDTPLWIARGWVGTREVIDPLKAEIDAGGITDTVGIINPPPGALADVVDTAHALVGFAIAVRPGVAIDVPAGAHEMSEPVAQALLSVLSGGRAPGT